MKLNKFVSLLVIGLVLTIAASGCRKKPVNTTVLPGQKAGKVVDDGTGGMIQDGARLSAGQGIDGQLSGFPLNEPGTFAGWLEDPQALKADTVYFDFDSSVLKTSEQPKVAAVADYLRANAGKAVRVEGNCDERGTEEYNRALGERRALAAREELIRLGVSPSLIDTKSFGKDNPANDPGHDESAWRKNRRDDFVVLTKPGS